MRCCGRRESLPLVRLDGHRSSYACNSDCNEAKSNVAQGEASTHAQCDSGHHERSDHDDKEISPLRRCSHSIRSHMGPRCLLHRCGPRLRGRHRPPAASPRPALQPADGQLLTVKLAGRGREQSPSPSPRLGEAARQRYWLAAQCGVQSNRGTRHPRPAQPAKSPLGPSLPT